MKYAKSLNNAAVQRPKIATFLLPAAILLAAIASAAAQNGTWTLNGTGLWNDSNNWQGSTVASGSGNTATFVSGGVTTVHLDSVQTIGNLNFSTGGSYLIDNNGNSSFVLNLDAVAPTITVAASSTVTISANISGTSGLTKANLGASSSVLVLTGNNTYSGTTVISGGNVGFVQVSANAGLGSSSVSINSANGGLRFGGAFDLARDISFGSSGGRLDTNGNNVTISSNISGSIAASSNLIKVGTGILTLAGNNTLIGGGGVSVQAGALKIDSNARLGGGTGTLTLNSGTIIYDGAFNDLRAITLGTSDGTLDTNGHNVTYSSAITGSAGQDLKKIGSGTLTLAGTQSYGGSTIVSAGTLLINGSHTSAAVNATTSAILGGTGTIGGATTIASTATLAPGDQVGTLTINNALTLANGSIYSFQGGDLVDVNGALTLNNNWTLALGSGLADGGSVVLFTYNSLVAGWDSAPTFDLTNLGFTPTGPLSLTDTGDSIVLNGVQVIPEPSSAAMMIAGLMGAVALARRRRVR